MEILIVIISILVITAIVWLVNKILPFKVCPICAGVSGTWFLLLVGVLIGNLQLATYNLVIAMLMGGTAVGMAYQGEKRFEWAQKNVLLFRTAVIIAGFILAYLALNNVSWLTLAIEAVVLLSSAYLFFLLPSSLKKDVSPENSGKIKELEDKMKDCC